MLVAEHMDDPQNSRLKSLVPSVGNFLRHYHFARHIWSTMHTTTYQNVSLYRYPSTMLGIILDLAQVKKLVLNKLGFCLFDGDQTLYSDGKNFSDLDLAQYIITFMQNGTYIALTTAAGYGLDAAKYEVRVQALLSAFEDAQLPEDVVSKFYVLGGECNYLLQCNKYYKLSPVENWNPKETGNADVEVVQRLINRKQRKHYRKLLMSCA